MWCAYPDVQCPGGYRYSDQDTGDGLSGECVSEVSGQDAGIDGPLDADLREWSAPTRVANVNSTGDDLQPSISANGLELFFWRGSLNPPYGEVFVASRPSTTQPFGTATPVTAVNTPSNENGVLVSNSGLELFVSQGNEITIATRATPAGSWSMPVPTGVISFGYSLTADGLSLYLVKGCGPGQHNNDGPCLFRADRASIGAAWSTPVFIEWPGATVQWNNAHVSGDGLRLLVSNPYSGSSIRAAESRRSTTTATWGPLQVINALALETTNADLRWNANETEVYLIAKPISSSSGFDIYVSVFQ
ncbi:MAG: hypothetical protein H0T46_01820 [Deltaproteobacteria bacterium]|nr:hypothetical protein [Deltaproteobacteria bacterium]